MIFQNILPLTLSHTPPLSTLSHHQLSLSHATSESLSQSPQHLSFSCRVKLGTLSILSHNISLSLSLISLYPLLNSRAQLYNSRGNTHNLCFYPLLFIFSHTLSFSLSCWFGSFWSLGFYSMFGVCWFGDLFGGWLEMVQITFTWFIVTEWFHFQIWHIFYWSLSWF